VDRHSSAPALIEGTQNPGAAISAEIERAVEPSSSCARPASMPTTPQHPRAKCRQKLSDSKDGPYRVTGGSRSSISVKRR
jgi:hypothetical protein